MVAKAVLFGLTAAAALIALYFTVVSLISGQSFALSQFARFWYFIVSLSLGFGVQIGLYVYLRGAIHRQNAAGKILAVSGTTSTGAMLSCCAHYLANILPVLGTTGLVSFVGQYQVELFWVGLGFNAAGIAYIASKVIKFRRGITPS